MTRENNPNYSNGTGTKETIRAIEHDLERHQQNLTELYAKIDSMGRANWQTILTAVGVIVVVGGGLWGLTVAPVNSDVARLDRGLRHIEGLAAQRGLSFEGNRVKLETIEATITRFREYFRRIETEFITAKEFSTASSIYMTRHAELQSQISTLNRKIDEVFPPQKTLEDLTRRLAELERTRVIQSPPLTSKP